MSGWGNKDLANNRPKFIQSIGMPASITNAYAANTILVSPARMANSNVSVGLSSKQFAHDGWVRIVKGTGGRAGRIQVETLVALNTATITTAASANGWFTS